MSYFPFKPITTAEINRFLKNYPGVKFINCLVVDMLGLIRGKQISINKLKSLIKPSVALPKSVMLQNSMGENFEIPSITPVDPDYFAHGITKTLMPALWSSTSFLKNQIKDGSQSKKKTTPSFLKKKGIVDSSEVKRGHVFLNLMDDKGHPFIYNGRDLVSKMAELIKKEFGYQVSLALELEFYMFTHKTPGFSDYSFKRTLQENTHIENYQMLEPINHLFRYPYLSKANSDCYGIDNLESISPFTERLLDCLTAQDIEIEGISSEYGNGQFEVNLKHIADPVCACDQAVLLKYTIKNLAKQFGINATFMAVPNLSSPNGMHINVSLQNEKGNNVFYRNPDLKGNNKVRDSEYISDTLMNCIGGLEHTANDAMLVFASNPNSYKRYYCQGYSPGSISSWGINNRTVSLRVPAFNENDPNFHKTMRIEHRLAGADSNPYLATAAVLGGMYWGLKKKIKPSKMEKKSTYRIALWESEIPSMVNSLQYWKKKQNLFRSLFGQDFCHTFYEHRIAEWNYFMRSLSQLDFDWYSQY